MKILNEIITFTEWLIDRLGIETNGMKKRREEHELLVRTSQNLTALQERYTENSIQINNLMIAQREILADKINEKYKYYISLNGIPEDEVEEFTNLHQAYKGVGGNHSGGDKYEYCMNHLFVIPVETKLITEHG